MLFNYNHNPDVLNTLANLSNDEVFTPPQWANKLLEVWNNNKKFLEKKYGKPKINKDFIQPKKVANRVINLAK